MKTDFERWLDYHQAAYPGFGRWIQDNSPQVRFMGRLLGHYEYDELTAATDLLYASDDQPNGYSNHARAIRRLCNPDTTNTEAAKEGPRVIDGRLTAHCPRCMDYGIVEVLSPPTLKELLASETGQGWLRTCVLACSCHLGSRKKHTLNLCQWEDGHALFTYESVMNRAMDVAGQYDSIQESEWATARQMLLEYDQERAQR